MKDLIITCDDFGMHPTINGSICDILSSGLPVRCSLMAPGAAFDDAVDRAQASGIRRLGVHLTLGSEYQRLPMRALGPIEQTKTFTDSSGVFYPDISHISGKVSLSAIQGELERQVDRVLAAGFEITHLDGHMFFYDREVGGAELEGLVINLADKLGVEPRLKQGVRKCHCLWAGYDTLQSRFDFYDDFFREEHLGTHELIIHPGKSVEGLSSFTGAPLRRYADYLYFTHPTKVRELSKLNAFQSVNP